MANVYIQRGMPYLSDEEIENRTAQLLAEFQKVYGPILTPPIPVDYIIEGYLDLRFDWDLIEDTDSSPILARLDPISKTITMNTGRRGFFDTYFGSEKFTSAHELGHWKLHIYESEYKQLSFDAESRNFFLCRSNRSDRLEIQANIFASCLLMPRSMVLEAFRSMDVVSWGSIYRLAGLFEVSKSAMTNRLKNLSLIRIKENDVLPTNNGQERIF